MNDGDHFERICFAVGDDVGIHPSQKAVTGIGQIAPMMAYAGRSARGGVNVSYNRASTWSARSKLSSAM